MRIYNFGCNCMSIKFTFLFKIFNKYYDAFLQANQTSVNKKNFKAEFEVNY